MFSCALMLWSPWLAGEAAAVGLAGLSFATVYPTVLALAGDRYLRFSGSVFGVLFSVGLMGGIVSPSAIGLISARADLRYMPVVPLAGATMILILTTVIMRRDQRKS